MKGGTMRMAREVACRVTGLLKRLVHGLAGRVPQPRRMMAQWRGGYDAYWARHLSPDRRWEYGIHIAGKVFDAYRFDTVLDAGCGTATVVREFLRRGKVARGVELSSYVLEEEAPDLLADRTVQPASLCRLPFPDNAFDLVVSFDVLEHVPEGEIPVAISELVRVAKRDLFLTISLRPSSGNNRYHCTLKSRAWWETRFEESGARVNSEVRDRFQERRPGASVEALLREGPAGTFADEMRWFWGNPPYDFQGEQEPWFFAFRKVHPAVRPLATTG